MGRLIKFEYIGTAFIVQSYLKNDFANICEINGESFKIDFKNNSVIYFQTPSLKQNKKQTIGKMINVLEVKNIIEKLVQA